MVMSEMSDLQRALIQRGTGQKLYTELEFNTELGKAIEYMKQQFMDATQFAIINENQECAKLAHDMDKERYEKEGIEFTKSPIADAILKRIKNGVVTE